jgi:hypothetical protein
MGGLEMVLAPSLAEEALAEQVALALAGLEGEERVRVVLKDPMGPLWEGELPKGEVLPWARAALALYREAFRRGQSFMGEAVLHAHLHPLGASAGPSGFLLGLGKAEGPLAYLLHLEEERRARRAFYRSLLAYWRRAAEMVLREAQEGLGLEVYPFPDTPLGPRALRVLRGQGTPLDLEALRETLRRVRKAQGELLDRNLPCREADYHMRRLEFLEVWLTALLRLEGEAVGRVPWGQEAEELWRSWGEAGRPPIPCP